MADFTTYPLEKFQANLIIAVGSLDHILHRQLSDCFEHLLNRFKKKMAMLLDNNLGGDLKYAKDLLREIAKLKFWGIGAQYSIECLRDDDFVEALADANCRMSFLGMESLNEESLRGVQKKQNQVGEYKEYFDKLNRKGILTFTGLMFALDEDTKEYYETLPEKLEEVGCNVILPSISIPIYGTPLYDKIKSEGRLIDEDISHYEGDHVLFRHNNLSEEEIYKAYKRVNKIFYSWKNIFRRWIRFVKKQSVQESIPQFVLKVLISTVIYFKLSIFQKHHAQERVFHKNLSTNKTKLSLSRSPGIKRRLAVNTFNLLTRRG
ncbi:MAG: DUF4070 domain-containing protein [Chlorobium sp.]|nr:DUF4070 domain-containing protein [Chlorobium sp.]